MLKYQFVYFYFHFTDLVLPHKILTWNFLVCKVDNRTTLVNFLSLNITDWKLNFSNRICNFIHVRSAKNCNNFYPFIRFAWNRKFLAFSNLAKMNRIFCSIMNLSNDEAEFGRNCGEIFIVNFSHSEKQSRTAIEHLIWNAQFFMSLKLW